MANGRMRNVLRKVDRMAHKIGGKFYEKTLGVLKYKIRYSAAFQNYAIGEGKFSDLCWNFDRKEEKTELPLVSVIVPNYNHEAYLRERLESIYNQTYQKIEVILLDDCSTDNSCSILEEYANKYPDKTTTIFNQHNVGRVFEQWNRGILNARGELIWIAESDDYCELNFLEEMVKLFRYSSVKIAFARSVFVQEGEKIWSTEEYLHDLNRFKWNRPFFMTAHNMVRYGFAIHNMIPNASSAVFRNMGGVSDDVVEVCRDMRLSSDWIFYLDVMRGGVVGYTNTTTNYYRIHKESTSLKVQHEMDYYKEFEMVSCYVEKHYKVDDQIFEQVLENLMEHYKVTQDATSGEIVKQYYDLNKIWACKEQRLPNVLMACYALKSGGGETYPIYLANELSRKGVSVTFLNFNIEDEEPNIRKLISAQVPIVTIKSLDFLKYIIVQLGGDVIHSHHASIDEAIAQWLNNNKGLCNHVITLHGMYESIDSEDCDRVIRNTWKSCFKYIYIADKNLECFTSRNYSIGEKFIKMPNGLPMIKVNPMERKELGIPQNAFVLVIASRGLKEKGWREGIDAVVKANTHSTRPIHLVIVGDGEIRKELEKNAPDYVHFVGIQSNVRDYFAMADVGFVPTYFKGESYPLVIIECLMTGRPVIATDIAEVKNQLQDGNGQLAGKLIPMDNWSIDANDICNIILELVNDEDEYLRLKARTVEACKKFDISDICDEYLNIYQQACIGL